MHSSIRAGTLKLQAHVKLYLGLCPGAISLKMSVSVYAGILHCPLLSYCRKAYHPDWLQVIGTLRSEDGDGSENFA